MPELPHLTATRVFYDAIIDDYTARFRDNFENNPMGRAMLALFAELVRRGPGGPVLDVGSGPGQVTAFLRSHGLDVSGVDLSPEMVAYARRTYPEVRYEVGTMTALDVADGSLGGLCAHYSIIHTPDELLPEVFAGFHRALAPGGTLLVAFQVGDEPLRLDRPFGHDVSLDFNRLSPDRITELVRAAGFDLFSQMVRQPRNGEVVPQAFLLFEKPSS